MISMIKSVETRQGRILPVAVQAVSAQQPERDLERDTTLI